jgi:hypothetical protein
VTSPEYIFLYGDPQFEAIKGHVDYDVARLLCGDQGIDIDETFKIEHLHARWVPSDRAGPRGLPDHDRVVPAHAGGQLQVCYGASMSLETNMRDRVVAALRKLDAVSVENGVGAGTPDVNYVEGWLELKSLDEWPKRASTKVRIEHYTQGQRVWIYRRYMKGGVVYLLLKVANDWLLFDGGAAYFHVGKVNKKELFGCCVWRSEGLDEEGLLDFLTPSDMEDR